MASLLITRSESSRIAEKIILKADFGLQQRRADQLTFSVKLGLKAIHELEWEGPLRLLQRVVHLVAVALRLGAEVAQLGGRVEASLHLLAEVADLLEAPSESVELRQRWRDLHSVWRCSFHTFVTTAKDGV